MNIIGVVQIRFDNYETIVEKYTHMYTPTPACTHQTHIHTRTYNNILYIYIIHISNNYTNPYRNNIHNILYTKYAKKHIINHNILITNMDSLWSTVCEHLLTCVFLLSISLPKETI